MIPFEEDDGTMIQVTLELFADGTGILENTGVHDEFIWDCDGESLLWITMGDGRNYYMTPYTMGGEDTVWLLLGLEECMVWLY